MTYYLNSDRMRVVQKNDRGLVTYRKRYGRGDEVDTSKIEDAQVENLLRTGALVESEDDVAERGAPRPPYRGSEVTGAATGEAGENPEHDTDRTIMAEGDGEDDGELVDEYSGMDYAELQQAAKGRGLNAGGSADDLRARLRVDDGSGSSDEG